MIDYYQYKTTCKSLNYKNKFLTNRATFLLYSDTQITQWFYSLSITEGIFVFTTVFKHIIKIFNASKKYGN